MTPTAGGVHICRRGRAMFAAERDPSYGEEKEELKNDFFLKKKKKTIHK